MVKSEFKYSKLPRTKRKDNRNKWEEKRIDKEDQNIMKMSKKSKNTINTINKEEF